MAGQRENDEVMRDVEASFEQIKHLRPTHRTVSMWKDVRTALDHIRTVEFQLGFLPEKPAASGVLDIDFDGVRCQLQDAREVLGMLALALADGVER